MKSAVNRSQQLTELLSLAATRAGVAPPADATAGAMAQGAVAATTLTPPPPAGVVSWLAELMLLYGVPFEYLVPTSSMLPPESLRFFFLDQNWTNRLIDGAASVGVGSTIDQLTIYAALEQLVLAAATATPTVRASLLGQPLPKVDAPPGTITGFLLRSAAVSGWPGLEVAATDAAGKSLIPPLRFERLAPDILFCLFNGVPTEVELKQPTETMHFGVVTIGGAYQVTLRYPSGPKIGWQIGDSAIVCPTVQRSGASSSNVINVQQTVAAVTTALINNSAPPPNSKLTSGLFGIEMVQAARLQPFKAQIPPPAAMRRRSSAPR